MIRLRDWRERLRERTGYTVHGAAGLAEAQSDLRRDTAYVMYVAEDPDQRRETVPDQLHRFGVAVVLGIATARDGRGEAAIDEMEERRRPVLRALLGWSPPGASGRVSFRRGRLLALRRGTLWWQDEFEVPAFTDLTDL